MISLRRHKNDYGGKGPLTLPADHVPAIRVPKGGSCCKNCMFVDAKNHECKEPHYIKWNGSPKLPPLPLDEICSDWYDWPGSSEQAHNPRAVKRRPLGRDESMTELSQAYLDSLDWKAEGEDRSARDGDYVYMWWSRRDAPAEYSRIQARPKWRSTSPSGWEWIRPTSEQSENPVRREGQHYVWLMNQRGEPVGHYVSGPHSALHARDAAASGARRSGLDRAVSFGADPKAADFKIDAAYEARTGKKLF